jgi:hypothetical protein
MVTPEARDLVRRSRNHLKDLSTLECEERGRGSPTPGCGTVCMMCPSVSEWDDGESAVLEELARLSLFSALLRQVGRNLLCNQIPENIPIGIVRIQSYLSRNSFHQ